MGKRKMTPKSVIFYKIFGVNILITVVFIALISFICSQASFKMILGNMMEFNQEKMEEKCHVLNDRIRQVEESVNVITGDETVFKFLMTTESYSSRPTELLKIIRHFQNVCSNSSLIKGISLVDVNRNIILTEKTKMDVPEGFDTGAAGKQNYFVVRDEEGEKQLEFIQYFEPIRGETQIFIIITVDWPVFTANILSESETDTMDHYLLTSQGDYLSAGRQASVDASIAEWLEHMTSPTEMADIGRRNFVLYKNPSGLSDLDLVAVQDYTDLTGEAGHVNRLIMGTGVLMVIAASVIIYICTLYVYRPLRQLSSRIQNLTHHQPEKRSANEYFLIEDVVNELDHERNSLMKQYDDARPSLIRDIVSKLLSELYDEERFEYLKRMTGQEMKWELYILIISECASKDGTEKTERELSCFIKENSDIEGCFVTLSGGRGAGLFNTALRYEEFLGRMQDLKSHLEYPSVEVTLCISRGFKLREHMSLVYGDTLSNLERKFFRGKNTLIYDTSMPAEYKNEYYSRKTEGILTRFVVEGNEEEAFETLHSLTRDLAGSATDIQYTRFVYFQICSNLIQSVLDVGGQLPRNYNEKDIFIKVFRVETIQDLEQLAEEIVRACVKNFHPKDRLYSPSVEKAARYMEENYTCDLSLEDVANAVFLSSGYLSNIFKEESGYTVLEYMTLTRMKAAKELVMALPVMKVKDIAEKVGYNNVQSFIRYFKKYYGVTPMEFRKKNET